MRKLIIAYIKFWLRSTNQHGVQSPFVYSLVTKCFYSKKKHNAYSKLKNYKKAEKVGKRGQILAKNEFDLKIQTERLISFLKK